jgi:diguanylate cyclase (GGDEF)-like protein/PAS domain S-box-containing protein
MNMSNLGFDQTDALQERSELKSVVGQAPVSLALVDLDGCFVATSPTWSDVTEVVTGYDEVATLWPLLDCCPNWTEQFQRARLGETLHIPELELEGSFENTLYFQVDMSPWCDADGEQLGVYVSVVPCTDSVRQRKELEVKSGLLDAVLHNSMDGIIACDSDGRHMLSNERMCDIAGVERANMTPEQWASTYHIRDHASGEAICMEQTPIMHARRGEPLPPTEYRLVPTNGDMRDILLKSSPIFDADGKIAGAVSTLRDVTDEKKSASDLKNRAAVSHRIALTDQLTGLDNRAALQKFTDQQLDLEKAGSIAALFIDLNDFKIINDRLGHDTGDQLLVHVAKRMREIAGPDAFISRSGGDEFVIIITRCTVQDAASIAQKIVDDFAGSVIIGDQQLTCTASVGVACAPTHGDTYSEIVKRADIAMFHAKKQKLKCATVFRPEYELKDLQRQAIEADLNKSIERNELELYFQPVLCGRTQQVRGLEALVRWNHPRKGMVPPDEFIDIAEQSGFIFELGEWVLKEATAQMAQCPGLWLAVNVSPVQFKDPSFVRTVKDILAETGFDPKRLELEITEGVLMNDPAAALEIVNYLKSCGIRFALDDFGKGYSSLGYIQSFPFDKVKIDRGFINDLDKESKSAAVVQCVISLAKSLDLLVTAEGVETAAHEMLLKFLGCHLMQGYFYHRPVPLIELIEKMDGEYRLPEAA